MSFPLQIPLQNRKRFRLVTIACMAPLAPNTADIMSSSILALRIALGQSDPAITPQALAAEALSRANSNLGRNTYIHRDPAWTLAQAGRVAAIPRQPGGPFGDSRGPLWGIPVSVKDCFDLAGAPTSCGTHFYRDFNGPALENSWLVNQLQSAGAVITGKTHLHPLAYGITGENPDFGDCLQPVDPSALTGGSSSGAAASVQEGSALAAIGTDTGGSIRVPAALCGLAGYRASIGRGNWEGGAHLAETFDTMGWLFRHLEDGPLLGSLLGSTNPRAATLPTRFAIVSDSFLQDCDPEVAAALYRCRLEFEALGLTAHTVDVSWWAGSMEIFAPLQAIQAAKYHAGHYDRFEASIAQRLAWGASLPNDKIPDIRDLVLQWHAFRARMDALLDEHQLLLLPAAPVAKLPAGADHSLTRQRLLRYTTPVSLSGMPAVTIPFAGGGMQLISAREDDARLLTLAANLGKRRISSGKSTRASW
jgi:aspartyl-tRNA(Asn)/glutamyl-tRNA(Gln) amidotransferase subunit A